MKKGIVKVNGFLNEIEEVMDIYDLDEVLNFPNISKQEVNDITEYIDLINGIGDDEELEDLVGFAKHHTYTDEEPRFIQVYDYEVELV